ncbi:MAG: hypothetical protein IJC74_08505 [Clostridia bacterium]|nr:hypothetical protein [Clostridia bacterium]
MKKSSFTAMMLGTVAGVLFSLGMCMALLPEWNAFGPGIVFGAVGILFGIITVIIWRKMENKAPIRPDRKLVALTVFGIVGALTLGIGLCFCLVWEKMIIGTIIGLAGILLLLCLVPLTKGIK